MKTPPPATSRPRYWWDEIARWAELRASLLRNDARNAESCVPTPEAAAAFAASLRRAAYALESDAAQWRGDAIPTTSVEL